MHKVQQFRIISFVALISCCHPLAACYGGDLPWRYDLRPGDHLVYRYTFERHIFGGDTESQSKATYTTRYVDPFDAFDLVAPPDRAVDRTKHLSERQRALLAKQGLDPDRLTYTQGQTILNTLFDRWDKGLASLKQCALLKRFGYETKNVTREQAGAIITQLKSNGWRRVDVQPV